MQQKQCTPRRYALHSMNGPMARTVLDSALFLDTMTQRIDSQNLPMPGWEKYPENPYEQIPCQSWQEIARRGQVEGRNETTSYSIAFSSLKCDAVRSEVRKICYRAAAKLSEAGSLLTVAGGGDTVAALAHAGVKDSFTHISTAGGAFLEWMEGKTLPGVAALGG